MFPTFSRLTAVEELAGIDVICCDKTGTLTKNELSIDEPYCFDNFTPEDVSKHSICNYNHYLYYDLIFNIFKY